MAKIPEKMEHEESLAGWSWVHLRGDGEGGEISSFRTSTASIPTLSSVLPSVREQENFHDEIPREILGKHQGNVQPKGQEGTGVKSGGSVGGQVNQTPARHNLSLVYVISR